MVIRPSPQFLGIPDHPRVSGFPAGIPARPRKAFNPEVGDSSGWKVDPFPGDDTPVHNHRQLLRCSIGVEQADKGQSHSMQCKLDSFFKAWQISCSSNALLHPCCPQYEEQVSIHERERANERTIPRCWTLLWRIQAWENGE